LKTLKNLLKKSCGKWLFLFTGLFTLTAFSCHNAFAQKKSLGIFENHSDVGKVKIPGTVTYNADKGEYLISGSGTNIWFDRDEFHYVWKKMKGDFILTTNGELQGKGVDPHRKLGWMVRSSLDSNSAHINAVVHGDGLTSLQFRRTKGANTEEVKSSLTGANVVQLERKGNTYTMWVAKNGETFVTEQVTDLSLGDEVYVGLFVCSHNKNVSETALFRNVRISVPARDNLVQYKEYIGSHLEVMEVASGNRKILYSVPYSIQAPNWTPDGKTLIYNSKGLLYNFDLATRKSTVLNTDFANNNNNDHVLSFDGKMIGISHQPKEDGGKSVVYTVSVKGGKPKRITEKSPSYLHGWSPDGKYLIYTAERNGDFDIYRISANGGEEKQLTTAKGLDDGSEYSPDGKHIYFNSTRSGLMQIWRMNADGSNPEQLTDDEFNNWFPHVSPDGKWIVMVSFLKDVAPDQHPFYKHVYLRLMPVSGGKPKVIAYLYGGQGTINVPSWSPDSKKIAFVSNSDLIPEPDKASVK